MRGEKETPPHPIPLPRGERKEERGGRRTM